MHYHVWFVTKYRKPVLDGKIERMAKDSFLEVARNKGYNILEMECDKDHVHMLVEAKDKKELAGMLRTLKAVSAKKILDTPHLRVGNTLSKKPAFWARRYGWKEIAKSRIEIVREYIRKQKTLLVAVLAALALLLIPQPAQATGVTWEDSAWKYRQRIIIDKSVVSGGSDLSNFPFLVKLTTTEAPTLFSEAQGDGDDILFTSNDGTTKLDHEIETFTTTQGSEALWAWVEIPTLDADDDTEIYIYYGSAAASDQSNATGVWDANYQAVWHLTETSGQHLDSTSNNNDSTTVTVGTQGSASAQINGADAFDGTNHYIDTADIDITGEITMEGWVYVAASKSGSDNAYIIDKQNLYSLAVEDDETISMFISWPDVTVTTTDTISTEAWHHIAATYDVAGGANNVNIYIDGSVSKQATDTDAIDTDNTATRIGCYTNSGGSPAVSWAFNGNLDEIRLSDTERTAGWIGTSYNNQDDPISYLTVTSPQTEGQWRAAGWTHRQSIIIDNSMVSGSSNLTNFPVLIKLTDGLNSLFATAQADADDIFFTSADGITKLDHEIEDFTTGAGSEQLIAWVEVPTLDFNDDTVIYMYYGDGNASDQSNATGVWDSNYVGVWHLEEAYSTDADNYEDSTTNANHGQLTDADTDSAQGTGKIGNCMDFNGDADLIDCGNDSSLKPNSVTVSAWIKSDDIAKYQLFVNNRANSGIYSGYVSLLNSSKFLVWVTTGSDWGVNITGDDTLSSGQWYHVVLTYTSGSGKSYVNGVQQTNTSSETGNISYDSDNFRIGAESDGYRFDGTIDEVRISNDDRSADWIATCYNNQNSPSTYLTFEEKERKSGDWYDADWANRQEITIDSSITSSDLTDFPYLVRITDASNQVFGAAQADGDDILFTDASGLVKLDHEVEKFVATGGSEELVMWVRIPFLDSSNDSTIYMYYGNSGAANQSNATGVWDTNYKGVWHLHDDFLDSTTNNNDGSNTGSDDATGQMADGQDFVAANSDYVSVTDHSSLSSTSLTLTAWVKLTTLASSQNITGKVNEYWLDYDGGAPTDDNRFAFWLSDGTWAAINGTSTPSTGVWYHLAAVYDGSNMNLYENGTLVAGPTAQDNPSDGAGDFDIGGYSGGPSNHTNGIVDEVRYSATDRSAAWIAACYKNQKAAYLAEEPDDWHNTDWSNRQAIIIDSSITTADLVNFPYMVKITDAANDVFDTAQADGDDILFTGSDGVTKLDHEEESFVATGGSEELIEWVRIPHLDANNDTVIYMYYGNDGAADQSNATGVWDANYISVWHLKETDIDGGAGDIKDSTTTNDGTTSGMDTDDQVAGQVDGSFSFDATEGEYVSISPSTPTLTDGAAFSVSWWEYINADTDNYPCRFILDVADIATDFIILRVVQPVGAHENMAWGHETIPPGEFAIRSTAVSTVANSVGVWKHFVLTGSDPMSHTPGDYAIYENGASKAVTNATANFATVTASDRFGYYDGGNGANAIFDEIRISDTVRSAAWVAACYNNQNSPGTYQTEGQGVIAGQDAGSVVRNAVIRNAVVR